MWTAIVTTCQSARPAAGILNMDYRKEFIVEPGKNVHLAKIDPSTTAEHAVA